MRYIAAYLLLKIAGKESPTAADVKKVISSVGIEVDEDRLSSFLSEIDGKDINAVGFLTLHSTLAARLTYHLVAHRRGHWQASLCTCFRVVMGSLS